MNKLKMEYEGLEIEKTSEDSELFYNFFNANGFLGCYSPSSKRVYFDDGCSLGEFRNVNLFLEQLEREPQ